MANTWDMVLKLSLLSRADITNHPLYSFLLRPPLGSQLCPGARQPLPIIQRWATGETLFISVMVDSVLFDYCLFIPYLTLEGI